MFDLLMIFWVNSSYKMSWLQDFNHFDHYFKQNYRSHYDTQVRYSVSLLASKTYNGTEGWSSDCHLLLKKNKKTFCALNLSPNFLMLLSWTHSVFCFMVVVVASYKAIKKQKRVQKRKHLLTFYTCLIQFLSISQMHDWTALVETGKHKLWIGLVLDPEHGWQWSDAKPFRYLRWSTGRTSSPCGSFPLFQGPFRCRDAEISFYVCWYHSNLFFPPDYFHFQFLFTFKIFPSCDEPDILWLNVLNAFKRNTMAF